MSVGKRVNPAREEMHRLIATIGQQEGVTVATIAREIAEERRAFYLRALIWLAKLGIVRISRG